MKTRFLFPILLVGILASCTDWQAEYKKQINEAFAPVKDKYEFAESIYKGLDQNYDCVTTNSLNNLSKDQQAMLLNYNDNRDSDAEQIYHPENWLIFHNSAKKGLGFNFGLFDSSYSYFEENSRGSYYYFLNDSTIKKKEDIERPLDIFKFSIVDKFINFKYLLVVTDKILVLPTITGNGIFRPGFVLSSVKLYDFNSKQEIGTFEVVSTNSDNVTTQDLSRYSPPHGGTSKKKLDEEQIKGNLYSCHRNNIMAKATKMVQNR